MALGGNSSWDKIQQGVKDTERLIVQREYNASMIKARQTLEFMVKNLADQAGIMDESDLKGMIDMLYENRWISKATCEHYHKIRMIGNKAAHDTAQIRHIICSLRRFIPLRMITAMSKREGSR